MARAAAAPARAPQRAKPAPAPHHPARRRPVVPARRPARRTSGPASTKAAIKRRGARILDALLSGRSWIGLVGVLLTGIVFFNVDLLQMNREITKMADRAAALKRENARLRLDYARLASSERIQETAAGLGLVLPAPGEVRYLESQPLVDARKAAKRMSAPDPTFVAPDPVSTVPEVPATTDGSVLPPTTTTDPSVIPPTTTTTAPPATTDPTTTTPPPTAVPPPTTTTTTTPPASGAVE